MTELLRPFSLAELRQLDQGRCWRVEQRIEGLDSLTPVQGSIQAVHHGTALEVTAAAETIITLCCDRCLQHFNHPLRADVHELVELRGQGEGGSPSIDAVSLELAREGMPEGADLDDRLDQAGSFDPERWLFEQLSLQLPLVNRCGDDCPGPATWSSEPTGGDPRWAALAQLGLAESTLSSESTTASGSQAAGRDDQGPLSSPAPSRGPIPQGGTKLQRDTGSPGEARSPRRPGVPTTRPASEPG